jgi:plastocyanin
LAVFAALFGAAGAFAACGSEDPNNVAGEPGKQLFVQKCGSCHVLEDAKTQGVVGPNLDAALKESLEAGMKRSTIEGVVRRQISVPLGEMPANLVKGKDADAVAAYVADAVARDAGKKTDGQDQQAKGGGSSDVGKANAQNEVNNPADPNGQLAYKYKSLEAKPGKVTLLSTNESSVPHNIAFEDGPRGQVVSGGKTSRASDNLKAGKYRFLCTVPGHAQAGMKGTLTLK